MYRKEDVLRKLNSDNYYIDIRALETFINDWQLDPIYEAKDGTMFYDDTAIFKLKKGISLKSQGYNNEQICYRIHKNPTDILEEDNYEEEQFNTSHKFLEPTGLIVLTYSSTINFKIFSFLSLSNIITSITCLQDHYKTKN